MRKSVTIILRGGLGNQMFQYAIGLAISRKKNINLVIDATFLNDRFPRKQFTYRTYDLDIFTLEPHFTALSKISSAVPLPGVWLGLDLLGAALGDILGTNKLIKEKHPYQFDSSVLDGGDHLSLWGFWQSPKYFADIEADVKDAFAFKHPLTGEAALLAEKIKNSNSISVHVRRADYLLPKYKSVYGATSLEYYNKAISLIAERVKDPTFFIFSDDIAWCRENIKPSFPTVYMDAASSGPKASFHLQLMSLCRHNIITNSSFSWWGAWLNRNSQKIVIAPKKWEISIVGDPSDVIPSDWILL
jgi:hypothetical protein